MRILIFIIFLVACAPVPSGTFTAQGAPTAEDPTPTREGPTDTPTATFTPSPTATPSATPYEFCGYREPVIKPVPYRCVLTMTPYQVWGVGYDGWQWIAIVRDEGYLFDTFWRAP